MPPHAIAHADALSNDSTHQNSNNEPQNCFFGASEDFSTVADATGTNNNQPSKPSLRTSVKGSMTKNRVSFVSKEKNQVHEIIHINDLKQQADITMIWYTEEDYTQIAKQCSKIIDYHANIFLVLDDQKCQLEKQNINDGYNQEYCIRGLELVLESRLKDLCEEYTPVRHNRRLNAIDAVLDEQDLQETEEIYDDELLADIYFNCSRECQIKAEMVALDDMEEVLVVKDFLKKE